MDEDLRRHYDTAFESLQDARGLLGKVAYLLDVLEKENERLRARVAELERDKSVLTGELERHAKGYYHEESARIVAQSAEERDSFARDADYWVTKYRREKEEVARLNAEIAAIVEPARALCEAELDPTISNEVREDCAKSLAAALDAAEKGEGARSLIAQSQRMYEALYRIAQCTPREIRDARIDALGYDPDEESEQDPVVIAKACLFDMEHPPADALGGGEEGR